MTEEQSLKQIITPPPEAGTEAQAQGQPAGVDFNTAVWNSMNLPVFARVSQTDATPFNPLMLTGGAGQVETADAQMASGDGQGDPAARIKQEETTLAYLREILAQMQATDGAAPKSEPYDQGWNALLNDPSIDRTHSDKTDGQGHELWERSTKEVQTIEVRKGHKEGDPPANYVIDKDGKVHELIPPDKKAMGEGDDQIVIEFADPDAQSAQIASDDQRAAANQLIAEIQANAAYAGLAPDIPQEILAMLVGKPVPAPRPMMRSGPGGVQSVPGFANGGNYTGPPGGGFERPSIPNRAPVGDAHAAVAPAKSKFDASSIKDSSIRKIVQDVVGKNEGNPTSINWNDNGHGISAGIFQWNQKSGELPSLLQRMAKDHPAEFKAAFGADADNMTKESFIRGANISPNSRLGAEMQTALNNPVLQQTELQMAADKVAMCAKVAGQHGVTSEAGVALFTDLVNQFGMGDTHRGAMKYLLAAQGGGNEEQKFQLMNKISSDDSHWRKSRNPTVVKEIADAGLSLRAGSMLNGNNDGTANA